MHTCKTHAHKYSHTYIRKYTHVSHITTTHIPVCSYVYTYTHAHIHHTLHQQRKSLDAACLSPTHLPAFTGSGGLLRDVGYAQVEEADDDEIVAECIAEFSAVDGIACVCVCVRVCVRVCVYVFIHVCTHTHTNTRTHVHMYVYIHVCVYIYPYTYTYMHTDT